MLRSLLLVFSAVVLCTFPTVAADPLAADIKGLAASAGQEWRSAVLEMKLNDDSLGLRVLVLEFAPPSKEKPDQIKVKLSLATPIEGDPFNNSSSSLSTGGFRDVKLEMKDDFKTITITRSLDPDEKSNKNTQRSVERTAISFTYELKGDSLTLKGFSKVKPTNWGQLSFTVPESDIVVKPK